MARRIEWNPEHKNSDEQQEAFVERYLSWTASQKWEYLMALISHVKTNSAEIGKRRIEWK